MERYTGSQYDDDLTVGMDEYDDSLQTGDIDLLEFVSDEESPITRLKTIILSIDWEITDDILRQFNIELLDLKDIWANDKIKLVYIQALEKISKYIYKEKADANPNAIKLLLNLYSNLEKVVTNESMPEEQKKSLLMADVEKFEKLKRQISRASGKTPAGKKEVGRSFQTAPSFRIGEPLPTEEETEDPLLNLKAIVFGMDWEITDDDLVNLGEEVRHLEEIFTNSKAKLIFLQGIGALGAYINLKRSNAHADAFKLLHSFFLSLENCVRNGLTGEEEKKVLMPEVEKFNAFKSAIAPTISPEAIAAESSRREEPGEGHAAVHEDIAPAFADMPEDLHGFQEEEEATTIGAEAQQKVEGQIDRFFGNEKSTQANANRMTGVPEKKTELIEEMESRLDGFFGQAEEPKKVIKTPPETALQGVDVETEADDDSEEEDLPRFEGELAPALSENFEQSAFSETAVAGAVDEIGSLQADHVGEGMSGPADQSGTPAEISAALEGVEVETEADDDSEEESLPLADEELAPALFSVEEEFKYGDAELPAEEAGAGIEDRLESFFAEEPEQIFPDIGEEKALRGVDVGSEAEEEEEEREILSEREFAPALFSENDAEQEILSAGREEESMPSGHEEGTVPLSIDLEEEKEISVPVKEGISSGEELTDEFQSNLDGLFTEETDVMGATDESSVAFDDHLEELFLEDREVAATGEPSAELEDELEEFFIEEDTEAAAMEESAGDLSAVASEPGEEIGSGTEDVSMIETEHPGEEGEVDLAASHLFELEEADEIYEPSVADNVPPPEHEVLETDSEEEMGVVSAADADFEPELMFEEVDDRGLDKAAEPIFTAADEQGAAGLAELQENEDFIEYIEGVEFDSEEEAPGDFEPLGQADEVVFEAVDEEGAEPEDDGLISFGEVEEELDRYLAQQEPESAEQAEKVKQEPHQTEQAESFGESFEQEFVGSELLMEVFPEPDKSEEISVGTEMEGLTAEAQEQTPEDVFAEDELPPMAPEDVLAPLRNCVVSLGLEIKDSILENLLAEINRLHNQWITKPVERIFLQLLSTVAHHIDHYRDQASPEAYGLLMSTFNKLEHARLTGADSTEVQEGLLAETAKILQWQQQLLSRKAMGQVEDSGVEFEEVGEDAAPDAGDALSSGDKEEEMRSWQQSRTQGVRTPETEKQLDTDKVTRIVRDELKSLRQSFREEMGELLRQHFADRQSRGND